MKIGAKIQTKACNTITKVIGETIKESPSIIKKISPLRTSIERRAEEMSPEDYIIALNYLSRLEL